MTAYSRIRRLPAQTVGIKGFFARIAMATAAWRQRRALERLDNASLRDIGLTRDQALAESRRRLWDVPAHWRN